MGKPPTRKLYSIAACLAACFTLTTQGELPPKFFEIEHWAEFISDTGLSEQWQKHSEEFHRWSKTWEQFTKTAEAEFNDILRKEIRMLSDQSNLTLDPWGGIDQESNFIPPIRSLSNHEGVPINDFGGDRTIRQIPPFYRLAELLGLGTNRLDLEFIHIDPSLEKAEGLGYLITARARNEIVARFADALTEDSIEIKRLRIDSYLPFSHTELVMGPNVPLRKFRVNPPVPRYLTAEPEKRRWHQEQIGSKLPDQAAEIFPSVALRRDYESSVRALRLRANDILKTLRKKSLQKLDARLRTQLPPHHSSVVELFRVWETSQPNLHSSHYWSQALIPAPEAVQTQIEILLMKPPIELLEDLAAKQARLAKLSLINGLRQQLQGTARERATEQYLNMVILFGFSK